MWTRHRNHMVYTEPWIYVALPGQEIEYMQMDGPPEYKKARTMLERAVRVFRFMKRLALLI